MEPRSSVSSARVSSRQTTRKVVWPNCSRRPRRKQEGAFCTRSASTEGAPWLVSAPWSVRTRARTLEPLGIFWERLLQSRFCYRPTPYDLLSGTPHPVKEVEEESKASHRSGNVEHRWTGRPLRCGARWCGTGPGREDSVLTGFCKEVNLEDSLFPMDMQG